MPFKPDQANNNFQEAVFDILPNPILIKNADLEYVFVNLAFEELFGVSRKNLIGQLDKDFFKERQVAQCNGGDLRVLETGEVDESYETVFRSNNDPREMITRKNRLITPEGDVFLVGVMHDISELTYANRRLTENESLLQKQSEKLEKLILTDPLTNCFNRRAFTTQVPNIFAKSNNKGCLLMMDIDFFKKINDVYGHEAGDMMLKHFTTTVKHCLRDSDNVIRLGGEEFAVILPDINIADARITAERIRSLVASSPLQYKGDSISTTVSIGLVQIDEEKNINVDKLLHEGDDLLYRAKREGRNRVVCV